MCYVLIVHICKERKPFYIQIFNTEDLLESNNEVVSKLSMDLVWRKLNDTECHSAPLGTFRCFLRQ